uniref:Uncharacterized protein n=1 Tax=Ixodes ricinus TaxID=34613 RepID=A0A6B0UR91_IXORI
MTRNISDDPQFTDGSFWFHVYIVYHCVMTKLPEGFVSYESIYRLVVHDECKLSNLEAESFPLSSVALVTLCCFRSCIHQAGHIPSLVSSDFSGLFVSRANVERAFLKLRVANGKKRTSLGMCACIYYNNEV